LLLDYQKYLENLVFLEFLYHLVVPADQYILEVQVDPFLDLLVNIMVI
jgi:hypothetical protein